jgi:UDP-N-acetylmuramate--alanine ligase
VLAAARAGAKRQVIAVVEPHRYTRVKSLFDEFATCFKDADHVIVAPLYTAGEAPIEGISAKTLAAGIASAGHGSVVAVDTPQDLVPVLRNLAGPGDMVICMGAGNSTEWAHALPDWLAAIPLRVGSAV